MKGALLSYGPLIDQVNHSSLMGRNKGGVDRHELWVPYGAFWGTKEGKNLPLQESSKIK